MCRRFTQLYTWVYERLNLHHSPQNLRSIYNVWPIDPVDVAVPREKGMELNADVERASGAGS
jgi:hypothetical protein